MALIYKKLKNKNFNLTRLRRSPNLHPSIALLSVGLAFIVFGLLGTTGKFHFSPPSAVYPLMPKDDGDLNSAGEAIMPPYPKGIWSVTKAALHHEVEGYTDLSSVTPGSALGFLVSCKTNDKFSLAIYRMGYYNGAGARVYYKTKPIACFPQKMAGPNGPTGLITENWKKNYAIGIPRTWPSGYYVAKFTNGKGFQNEAPFVLKAITPSSDILLIHAASTDAAYNSWGGNSLYVGAQPHYGRAFQVSLNRPLLANNGAGEFLNWEYPMAMFLEKNNFHVDYATDFDINDNPGLLLSYKTVIDVGHDEYWTWNMQTGFQNAINHGVNLAIFGANTDYRPTRYGPDPVTKQRNRIVINYKQYSFDPEYWTDLANRSIGVSSICPGGTGLLRQVTLTGVNWRGYPFCRPESQTLGSLFEGQNDSEADLTVASSAPGWFLTDSGLSAGSSIPHLVGYEYDRYYSDPALQPANVTASGVQVVFHSLVPPNFHPVDGFAAAADIALNNGNDTQESVYYAVNGGGQVFNSGTNNWAWGLDSQLTRYYSPELSQVTLNIINHFLQ